MKSRIAVAMMLVCGFLLSGTGAGLAVSGISGAGSAADLEYPAENPPTQAILGQGGQGGTDQGTGDKGTSANQGTNADQGVAGEGDQGAAQPARQVAVTGGDEGLPFTGFAAIPLLLVGVGLVGAGFLARRGRTASD